MPNEYVFQTLSSNDMYYERDSGSSGSGAASAGRWSGSSAVKGAYRFPGVTISQGTSIQRAGLYLGPSALNNANTVRLKFSGIKETNTGNFSSSPFGRTKTSNQTTQDNSQNSNPWDVDITNIVQEIINQGGWSSGNALGLIIEDNGSDNGTYFYDGYGTGDDGLLSIRLEEPDLSPTPTTVAAPTFPDPYDYGLKIAKPGYDVKTATEAQLLFTTRKNYLKILAEGQVSTSAGIVYQIAHGLAYAPQAIAFARANGYSFQLPRIIGSVGDPVGGGLQGELRVNSTHLRLYTSIDATVYYYVFLDPLST